MSYGFLGDLCQGKVGIKDFLEERYFEFYIAGYTKICQGTPVQPTHALLYSHAVKLNKIESKVKKTYEWPFGEKNNLINVFLKPEPENKYDPYALIVQVVVPLNLEQVVLGTETSYPVVYSLGYVPRKISKFVLNNLDRIEQGWIKKVRSVHNNKFCSTKVAFSYKLKRKSNKNYFYQRFGSILK